MELINISQCANNLQFQFTQNESPIHSSVFLPFAFENELLIGFSQTSVVDSLVLNYEWNDFNSYKDFFDLIKKLYNDNLSFVELVRFYHKWIQLSFHDSSIELNQKLIDPVLFFSYFGYRYSENLQLTMNKILVLPENFQEWCNLKKWGPQDFAPLRSLNNVSELNPFLELMSKSQLSKSDSTPIFELLIELLLLENKNLNSLLILPMTQWGNKLKEWRFPIQNKHIGKDLPKQLSKIPWPLNTQVKWIQKGDRSGIELKLFFSHPQELDRAVIKLQQTVETFKNDIEAQKLWNIE